MMRFKTRYDMAKRAFGRFLRRWGEKNSFPGSLSALRSMVTMLKSKWRCVAEVLQVNQKKNALRIFSGLCIFTFRISFIETQTISMLKEIFEPTILVLCASDRDATLIGHT
jgi:hypothetical protein